MNFLTYSTVKQNKKHIYLKPLFICMLTNIALAVLSTV